MSPLYSTNPDVFFELHKANARDLENKARKHNLAKNSRQTNAAFIAALKFRLGSFLISLGRKVQGCKKTTRQYPESFAAASNLK